MSLQKILFLVSLFLFFNETQTTSCEEIKLLNEDDADEIVALWFDQNTFTEDSFEDMETNVEETWVKKINEGVKGNVDIIFSWYLCVPIRKLL